MREVVLHLPDATYEQLATGATAVDTPLEQWILDILMTALGTSAQTTETHAVLTASLDTLGFARLAPEQTSRLSALLQYHKERPLAPEEQTELQTLMEEAHTLEYASLQRLAAALGR